MPVASVDEGPHDGLYIVDIEVVANAHLCEATYICS